MDGRVRRMGTTNGSMLSSEDKRWGVKRGAYENTDQKREKMQVRERFPGGKGLAKVEALVEEFPKLSRASYGTTEM